MSKQHRNNYTPNNITNNKNLPNFKGLIIVEKSTIDRLTKLSDYFQLNNRYLAKFNNNISPLEYCNQNKNLSKKKLLKIQKYVLFFAQQL